MKLESILKKQKFNGSVYNGKQESYNGFEDVANKKVITQNSQFYLASVSKMYTSVMIYQLIEKGHLALDTKVNKWFNLPHFFDVTIYHLLTHTSGLPEYIGNLEDQTWDMFLKKAKPLFPCGSSWLYSNTNYVLLADIVEIISGQSYEEYLQENIAKPLQLSKITTKPQQAVEGQVYHYYQHCYQKVQDDRDYQTSIKYDHFLGDGGIYSTAKEVGTFLEGFAEGKLLSMKWVQQVLTPSSENPHYASGFIVTAEQFGHSGGWPGFSAHANYLRKKRNSVVLLTNQEVFPAFEMEIMDYLQQKSQTFSKPKLLSIIPFKNDKITGSFQLEDEWETPFSIFKEEGRYQIQFAGQLSVSLLKVKENQYWIRNTMSFLDMEKNFLIEEGEQIPFSAALE